MPFIGPIVHGVTSAALEIPIRVDNNGVQSVSLSSGITFANTAGGAQKAEDSAHADGDMGLHTLGVRRGATPVVATSAIGDYGSFAIDGEGKIIISGSSAAPEQTEQAYVSLTGVTDTSMLLLSGVGVRHYITDVVFANTGGSASTVYLKFGTTIVAAFVVPGNSTIVNHWETPLQSGVNVMVNAALAATGTVLASISGYRGI